MNRRSFLATLLAATGCQSLRSRGPTIQTVLGPIPAGEFGFALTHEHIMCDFVGAEKTGPHRWKVDEVVRTMQPHLEALRKQGVTGFVDCTPAYIGRDRLSITTLSWADHSDSARPDSRQQFRFCAHA